MNLVEAMQNYIKPELLVLIFVLYFIGIGIKNTEKIKNKYIPIILGCIGIIISAIYVVATSDFNGYKTVFMGVFTAIVQGVLVAGASVYINELIKQNKKEV